MNLLNTLNKLKEIEFKIYGFIGISLIISISTSTAFLSNPGNTIYIIGKITNAHLALFSMTVPPIALIISLLINITYISDNLMTRSGNYKQFITKTVFSVIKIIISFTLIHYYLFFVSSFLHIIGSGGIIIDTTNETYIEIYRNLRELSFLNSNIGLFDYNGMHYSLLTMNGNDVVFSTTNSIRALFDMLYFVIVSFTSTGFGDITPIGPVVRMVTSVNLLMGHFIVVLVIAISLNMVSDKN